jgi:hypothetical protein
MKALLRWGGIGMLAVAVFLTAVAFWWQPQVEVRLDHRLQVKDKVMTGVYKA